MAQCQRLHPDLEAMRVELQWLAKRGGEQRGSDTNSQPAQQLSCCSDSLASHGRRPAGLWQAGAAWVGVN